jgi:integrase
MPTTVLRTVPRLATQDGKPVARRAPGRTTNAGSGRTREYLIPGEVDRLVASPKSAGAYGNRDALAILMCFRHGLRASELCGLTWSQVEFTTARLTVCRLKGSIGSTQPIAGDELRQLRKLQRTPGGRQPLRVRWPARSGQRRLVRAHAVPRRRRVRATAGPPALPRRAGGNTQVALQREQA